MPRPRDEKALAERIEKIRLKSEKRTGKQAKTKDNKDRGISGLRRQLPAGRVEPQRPYKSALDVRRALLAVAPEMLKDAHGGSLWPCTECKGRGGITMPMTKVDGYGQATKGSSYSGCSACEATGVGSKKQTNEYYSRAMADYYRILEIWQGQRDSAKKARENLTGAELLDLLEWYGVTLEYI